jgi:hypothetical protein
VKKEFIVERNGRSFVLYAGLLDLAHERGLKAITTTLVQIPSELNGQMAIVHATVETSQGTFTGLGDADHSNVSRMMVPHLIRMAETRAKARALRDAVNVGVTALEELGDMDEPGAFDAGADRMPAASGAANGTHSGNGRSNGRTAGVSRSLRALEPNDVVGAGDELPGFEAVERTPVAAGVANGSASAANGSAGGTGGAGGNGGGMRPGATPATPKQLQTIQRMARAAGKPVPAENLTRAQASEIISSLIGEMDQRAS